MMAIEFVFSGGVRERMQKREKRLTTEGRERKRVEELKNVVFIAYSETLDVRFWE